MNAQFIFEVKLIRCELFNVEPFKSSIPNALEMIINSKRYETHIECIQDVNELLSVFATLLEQVTDKKFIVTTVLNPSHETGKPDPNWDQHTLLRAFVCDADVFKKKNTLNYSIFANINISEEDLEIIHSRAGQFLQ